VVPALPFGDKGHGSAGEGAESGHIPCFSTSLRSAGSTSTLAAITPGTPTNDLLKADFGFRPLRTAKTPLVSCPRNKHIFRCDKNGPPATREEGADLNGYVTDEQRSRRPVFIATLWAAASWLFFRVARCKRCSGHRFASWGVGEQRSSYGTRSIINPLLPNTQISLSSRVPTVTCLLTPA
jgi:hypothetical protein